MPAVFVHGVPDTHRVWTALVSRLTRKDVVTLSLPGFGRPVPEGFDATKDAYVDWLQGELARQPAPIDLVGHDWGALLVVRAVSLRPEAVRSWVVGGAPLDPDYEWHPAARAFQTPGMGERVMESMTPAALQQALVAAGVPDADAAEAGRHVDPTMKRCILALYRSAVHVGTEWTDDLRRVTAPALVLWGERDPYAAPRFGARMAERTGARFVSLHGCSHWWQLERPDVVADELRRFW
jgi:pimeloyl-ACP methyl ester carboxylesterase